jgi:hypothetical protein
LHERNRFERFYWKGRVKHLASQKCGGGRRRTGGTHDQPHTQLSGIVRLGKSKRLCDVSHGVTLDIGSGWTKSRSGSAR